MVGSPSPAPVQARPCVMEAYLAELLEQDEEEEDDEEEDPEARQRSCPKHTSPSSTNKQDHQLIMRRRWHIQFSASHRSSPSNPLPLITELQ